MRRHGDPDSLLSPKVAVHTGDWEQPLSSMQDHRRGLGEAGRKRHQPLPRTIFRAWFTGSSTATSKKHVLAHTQPIFDPEFGIRLKPDNLAAFMVLSAVTMLFEKTPLRRCAHCEDWMSFSRSTAKTCSVACRNALSRQSGATGTDG